MIEPLIVWERVGVGGVGIAMNGQTHRQLQQFIRPDENSKLAGCAEFVSIG